MPAHDNLSVFIKSAEDPRERLLAVLGGSGLASGKSAHDHLALFVKRGAAFSFPLPEGTPYPEYAGPLAAGALSSLLSGAATYAAAEDDPETTEDEAVSQALTVAGLALPAVAGINFGANKLGL